MTLKGLDLSQYGWPRVFLLTALGTAVCVAVAFAIDSYSHETGSWRWGGINNLIIPLVLAPPFFFFLLSKLRELAIAHRELMAIASTDGLTSCLNRRAFTTMVDGYLSRVAEEQARPEGALLVIDVDHFKAINDSFGHERGDEALKVIAAAITDSVRDIDLVGRIGGEEFGVFLPGLDANRTSAVAERIRQAVHAANVLPSGKHISVSVGGAVFDHEATFSELYRCADQRLYTAKNKGRNRVEIYSLPVETEAGMLAAVH